MLTFLLRVYRHQLLLKLSIEIIDYLFPAPTMTFMLTINWPDERDIRVIDMTICIKSKTLFTNGSMELCERIPAVCFSLDWQQIQNYLNRNLPIIGSGKNSKQCTLVYQCL